jgi:hypothetical protein
MPPGRIRRNPAPAGQGWSGVPVDAQPARRQEEPTRSARRERMPQQLSQIPESSNSRIRTRQAPYPPPHRAQVPSSREARGRQGDLVLEVDSRTNVATLLQALDSVPPNRFLSADIRHPIPPQNSSFSGDRYVPKPTTKIYSCATPPTQQQKKILLDTIIDTIARQVGPDLRLYSDLRGHHEMELLRKNLGLGDLSQEASQIRLIIRVANAMPILKAWGSTSDQLIQEGRGAQSTFKWIRASDSVSARAAENAKSAILDIVEDACKAHGGERIPKPRDILPRQAMEWFDTPGLALTANVVRELGRHAEVFVKQYKSLPVEGLHTVHDLVRLMETLQSDTYICATRDSSGKMVLKTQLHKPSVREQDRVSEWLQEALRFSATSGTPGPAARNAIVDACWKIHDNKNGMTAIFLSRLVDELKKQPEISLPSPPYYGDNPHYQDLKAPRLPMSRDAKYKNILTKLSPFKGEEFDTPSKAGVLKLSPEELESCRAFVTAEGLKTVDGILINNQNMRHAMRGGTHLVYVMDCNGEIYIGADKIIQHSSFLEQVADAGQMAIDDDTGEITLIPWTGHMNSDEINTRQTEDSLRSQGLSNVKVVVIPDWE